MLESHSVTSAVQSVGQCSHRSLRSKEYERIYDHVFKSHSIQSMMEQPERETETRGERKLKIVGALSITGNYWLQCCYI